MSAGTAGARVPASEARAADLELASRCAQSPPDQGAWEQLYALHAAGVRQWIRRGRRLGGDENVEDMVQQLFLLCAQGALARFRGEVSLRSYLLKIAERVRINENRRLTRQCRDVRAELSLDAPLSEETPDETWKSQLEVDDSLPHRLGMWRSAFELLPDAAYKAAEVERRVEALLVELEDDRDRKILKDYFWQNRKDREIAEEMELSINTVTWRRHRSQARIEQLWCDRYGGKQA